MKRMLCVYSSSLEASEPQILVKWLGEQYERALRDGGAGDPRTIAVKVRLGTAMRATGDLQKAQQIHREAFNRAIKEFGKSPSEITRVAASELGLTMLAGSHLSDATEMLRRVYSRTEEQLGAESVESAAAAENLALAERARGDLPEARRLQEHAVRSLRATLGDQALATLAAKANLASVLGAEGHIGRAVDGLSYVVEVRTKKLGERHPLTIAGEAKLGAAYFYSGNLPALKKVVDGVLSKIEGDEATTGIKALMAIGLSASTEAAKREQGIELAHYVVRERSNTLGTEHPQTLYAVRILSQVASGYDETLARNAAVDAAKRSEVALGRGHLDTMQAFDEVAKILERSGEEPEAAELRAKNSELRAADSGIVGDEQPPIENLAGALTFATEPGEGLFPQLPVPAPLASPGSEVVTRTGRMEIEGSEEIQVDETFSIAVFVDRSAVDGEESGTGTLSIKRPSGVDDLDLDVWLVPSRHFEIEGSPQQILRVDLGREGAPTPRIHFRLRAVHPPEAFEEEPEVRAIFRYMSWPCGQVSLGVPLATGSPEEVVL